MFKKIFKAAKDLIKSPAGQLGIGLLLPAAAPALGTMAKAGGLKGLIGGIGSFAASNPMLTQAAAGLLGGAKGEDVLRNAIVGAGLSGLQSVGQGGTFMGGISDFTNVGEGKTGTIADFFKTKEKPDFVEFAKTMGANEESLLNPEIYGKVLTEYQKIPTASTFTNILNSPITPYAVQSGLTLALANMAADQAKEAQATYDEASNPFLAADGGGIQKFAMGTPEFPRMTGDISGPGTGTSDSIPAMLSDGEHVLTKQEVSQIGGGNNDLGHQKLYAMRKNLREQANQNGIGRV
jgi:hypothetical protein